MTRYIVLGATGHVGSATVRALLDGGQQVVAVVHDAGKADIDCETAAVDIRDSDALRDILRKGDRAFLINPPAPPASDTDAEENRSVDAILLALDGAGLEKIVAASTYGARPGDAIGDSSVLYRFEQGLARQPIPAAINRGAYYFSNWDASLASAIEEGVIHTPYPADFVLPMVAPEDLGRAAARRLTSGLDDIGIAHIEGPTRYTPHDVAATFAALLDKHVDVRTVPREGIERMFLDLGFSTAGAHAYTRMTDAALDGPELPDAPDRGTVTLWDYLAALVAAASDR